METINKDKVELTNSCICTYCPTCELGTIGAKCGECEGDTQYSNECIGCWEDSEIFAHDIFNEWCVSVGNPSHVRIEGSAMGWQRRSGYKEINAEWKDLLSALTLNGEWLLTIEREGDTFKIRRSSHDEPTGASFTLTPANLTCAYCGDPHAYKDYEMTTIKDKVYCNYCVEYHREEVGA